MEISVAEALELINGIHPRPANIFEMIRAEVQESVGQYLSGLMETELTHFLGRARYQRVEREGNHRNGSYPRSFTMKGIGEVRVKVPRDRQGQFNTQVIPRCKRYEKALQEDLCLVFLSG
jgi:transposase-like protein